MMSGGGGGAGYDISQSTSESATQGYQLDIGAFNVGGGLRIPGWVWIAGAVAGGLWLLVKLFRK